MISHKLYREPMLLYWRCDRSLVREKFQKRYRAVQFYLFTPLTNITEETSDCLDFVYKSFVLITSFSSYCRILHFIWEIVIENFYNAVQNKLWGKCCCCCSFACFWLSFYTVVGFCLEVTIFVSLSFRKLRPFIKDSMKLLR